MDVQLNIKQTGNIWDPRKIITQSLEQGSLFCSLHLTWHLVSVRALLCWEARSLTSHLSQQFFCIITYVQIPPAISTDLISLTSISMVRQTEVTAAAFHTVLCLINKERNSWTVGFLLTPHADEQVLPTLEFFLQLEKMNRIKTIHIASCLFKH